MHKELIEKPLIIAILGKSAAGKDTLAKFLTNYFTSLGLYTHNMISVTTRPKRDNEEYNVDYYFVSDEQFNVMKKHYEFIEHTHFRGWQYGIPFNEVQSGYINIGVFNLEGLKSLQRSKYDYTIIPVYINETLWTRLRRSKEREGKWKIEYIRRAFADWKAFRHIDNHLNKFHGRYVKLNQVDGVWKQSQHIEFLLERWGILVLNKEDGKMRLGNFV